MQKSVRKGLLAAAIAGLLFVSPVTASAQGFDFGDDGGGMDFGDDSGDGGLDFGSDAKTSTTVDTNSALYGQYTEARNLVDAKQYLKAAQMLDGMLSSGDPNVDAMSSLIHFEMGRALYEAGYHQSALNHFVNVLYGNPESKEYNDTLGYLVLIGRALPGEPERYSRIYQYFLDKFPADVPEALVSEVGYILAMAAYRESKFDDTVFFVGNVSQDSEYYPKSRYLEGVTYVRQLKGQPALDAFKEVLRWLDAKSNREGLTGDEKRLREYTVAALARVFYQVGSGQYNLGNKEKANSSWATSIKYYNAFSRDSEMWLDALFEASWAYYRVDNFSKALGLLLTLNSPFFNEEYHPEALILQATIYYTNCHYDRVVDILTDYKATYEPMKLQVDKLVARLFENTEVYDFLHMVQNADKDSYDPTLQLILSASVEDRELRRGLAYIDMLDDERKRIEDNSAIAGTPLAKSLVTELQATRSLAIESAGKKGKTRLERLQEELRDLSNRALDIEIETTEKYAQRAELREQDPNAMVEFEQQIDQVLKADDEHLFWTFDGEYWKDELGYYWYYISSRCGR